MFTNKKILFLTLLLVVLIFPISAHAKIIVDMVTSVATVITTVAGIVTVVCWVITGLLFLTAAGDPGRIGLAKKMAFTSIIGTALVILSGVAMNMINSALFFGE